MQFTTLVEIQRSLTLTPDERIFMIGSCFADEMTSRMAERGIRVYSNPFGVQYNPLSIIACLARLISGGPFCQDDLFYSNGLYHSFLHHGSFSKPSSTDTLEGINKALQEGKTALLKSDVVVITLGTAWVYEQEGSIVSNCHKLSPSLFTRRKLSIEEIATSFATILNNPIFANKKLIFNVSPIRHKKDGMHENQLSKASLLLAINNLQNTQKITYFPSYEIFMDELRDYRFYAEDMIHPTQQAVNYVWERFEEAFFSASHRQIMRDILAATKALQHRPLHEDTVECQAFLKQANERYKDLQKKYPWLQSKQ